jgi:hypothetical protein
LAFKTAKDDTWTAVIRTILERIHISPRPGPPVVENLIGVSVQGPLPSIPGPDPRVLIAQDPTSPDEATILTQKKRIRAFFPSNHSNVASFIALIVLEKW